MSNPTPPCPDVTDEDVTASVDAYIATGTDSTYREAIRAALETFAERVAARTTPTT